MNRRCICLLLLLTAKSLSAQTHAAPPLRFDRIPSELGLSQNFVSAIIQDRQGFLWIGTKDGLNRFDGYRFTVFRHEAFDSTSLSDNSIKVLREDREGRLWVGTPNGLHLFDRATEVFHRCPTRDSTRQQGLSHAYVTDIQEHPGDGALWIATTNGLTKLALPRGAKNLAEAAYTHFLHDPHDPHSLSAPLVHRVAIDARGSIWVATNSALHKISRAASSEYEVQRMALAPPDAEWKKLLDSRPQRYLLSPGQNGAIWIGAGLGLARWDAATSAFTYYKLDHRHTPAFKLNEALLLYEDRRAPNAALWIGSWNGLARFEPSTNSFAFYQHEPGNPNSAPESGVGAFFESEAGVLWLGSNGNGLFRYDPRARRFAQRGADGRLGLWQGTSLRALCEIQFPGTPAELWFGGANGRLYRMNRRSGEVRLVPPPPHFPNWDVVMTMLQDSLAPETIWIGNYHGLFRMEWKNGRAGAISHFKPEPESEWPLVQEVYDIAQDRDGEIWIVTPVHLMRLDRSANAFVRYRYASEDLAVLVQNAFSVIHQDRHGRFWLGTGEGLMRFDRATGAFRRYANAPGNPMSLSHNTVRAICEDPGDPQNVLWIGTAGGGLNRFDLRTETFTHFTTKDGLPNMVIYAILADGAGNLWMSTNRGLSRFTPWDNLGQGHSSHGVNPRAGEFKNFDANDGLQDNEFNASSHFKSASGELFFGGINGFNAFYPADIRDNAHAPPVVFTDFLLFNRPVSFKDENSPLTAPIGETTALTLSHEQNVFSFEFAALDYTDPAKNRYRYKMENFDAAWREAGTSRTATYTNLNPGEYVFRVQGSNNDGVWNEQGASIKITITPPWWQTWWAYLLYAASAGAALALAFKARLRFLEKRTRELETSVAAATAEVVAQKQRIEKQNEQLALQAGKLAELDRLKSRFFANLSHEFRTPLTLILGPVEQELAAAAEEHSRRNLWLVKNNAQRLLRLINQLLDLSKLESGKMQLRAAPGNLVEFLRGLVLSFAPMAERKHIALRFESKTETLLVYFDRDKAEKIFSNLLSNALKFTPEGGVVTVEMGREGEWVTGREGEREKSPTLQVTHSPSHPLTRKDYVVVKIKDTGIGIPAEKLPHVFDRFYQVEASSTRAYEGTGIGLALAKELVELHRGRISVTSAEGQGATFTVHLPLGRDHLAPEEIVEVSEQYARGGEQLSVVSDQLSVSSDQLSVGSDEEVMTPSLQNSNAPSIQKSINPEMQERDLVLLVEDHAEMRRFVRQELEPAYRVLEAADGEDGWHKALEAIPDVVISDVMMPKMNGYELCRRLKTDERTSHVPVILLTAKADQPDKLAGLETGADDYLSKPFDSKELAARVKNLIALRRKLQERFRRQVVLKPGEMKVESQDEAFLKKVMAVVEEHIGDENFEVDTLCRRVGMSRAQLQRKLKALVNQSPMELVRTMRLERAADLLRQNAGSIAEIAYQVGFSSQAHFTRSFHEHFGLPPSEYKKAKPG